MVFNDLFKKLDKISINKCKKPNEPVTYQQLESIIQNNRSIYFNDWVFFFIYMIFLSGFVLNTYFLQLAKKKMYEFCKKNHGNSFQNKDNWGNNNEEYKTYNQLNDFIKFVESVRPFVRGMVICFALIQYCRSSVNRITPILKDKCITPRVAYVFDVVMILLLVLLVYQIYMWLSMRMKQSSHVNDEQKKDLDELVSTSTMSTSMSTSTLPEFDVKISNKYSWIILFLYICSIIAHFLKLKDDLMFYLEFLFGGEMLFLLLKLYSLEVINSATMIKTGDIDDFNIVFDDNELKITKIEKEN